MLFTNGSGHVVPACYLELHEEREVEISTCPPHHTLSLPFLQYICFI